MSNNSKPDVSELKIIPKNITFVDFILTKKLTNTKGYVRWDGNNNAYCIKMKLASEKLCDVRLIKDKLFFYHGDKGFEDDLKVLKDLVLEYDKL